MLDEKLKFDIKEARLDIFYFTSLESDFHKLWRVIKLLLVLSHGQATVERVFSINSHFKVENMQKEAYVAKKTVQDEIKNLGGIQNIMITKEMIMVVSGSLIETSIPNHLPRAVDVANICFKVGHDFLQKQIHRIGVADSLT